MRRRGSEEGVRRGFFGSSFSLSGGFRVRVSSILSVSFAHVPFLSHGAAGCAWFCLRGRLDTQAWHGIAWHFTAQQLRHELRATSILTTFHMFIDEIAR
jgi:hypothetical protein